MITIALCGEQPDHHDEQNKVYGCIDKAPRDQKIIDEIKGHVHDGQNSGPAFRNYENAALSQAVATDQQGSADHHNRGNIQSPCRGEGCEAGEHQQIKRELKVAVDGEGKRNGRRTLVDG